MAEENTAVVLHGKDDIKLEPWPVEEPAAGQIQARMHFIGVCGTDVHYWKTGTLFGHPLTAPMVLGHENSAVVLKVGPGVTEFKPGDRVHLIPGRACHRCETCLAGKEHNCQAIKLGKLGQGQARKIMNHPVEYTCRIPDNLSMEEGALIEPFAVAVYAVERSALKSGQTCVIIGAGAVGIMIYLAAKLAGAAKCCIVDISEDKLKLAQTVGECQTVLASRDPKETAQNIEEALGRKPHVAFDASCTNPGISTAIYSTTPCGKVVLAGLAPENCMLPMQHAAINEIDLINMVRFGTCYPRTLEILAAGLVDLKPLIALTVPLSKAGEAFQATAGGLHTGFKAIIDMITEG